MSLVLRRDKGANLTAAEVDGNFEFVQAEIEDIQLHGTPGVGVVSFEVTGSQFRVHLSDGTVLGPYALPTALFEWQGDWLPDHDYRQLEFFTVPDDGLYVVLEDHTSPDVFNPAQNNGPPHYATALRKVFGFPTTATPFNIITIPGDYTLSAGDAGCYLRFTSATPVTLYVPTLFEDGQLTPGFNCVLRQAGDGQVTIAQTPLPTELVGTDAPVLVFNSSESLSTRKRNSTVTLVKAPDGDFGEEWDVEGNLALEV